MARIVVYYYVLLVDFFKDTKKKMSSISPLDTLSFISRLRFCIYTKKNSLKISTASHDMFSRNLNLQFFFTLLLLKRVCSVDVF